jgi:hypothetical protein
MIRKGLLVVVVVGALVAPAEAGAQDATFRAVSDDGTRAFFTTDEKMVAEDADSAGDIYERAGSTTTLLSIGPAGGNANGQTAFFEDTSDDGSVVIFGTFEPLVAGDTDDDVDLYARSAGTTTQVSAGQINGNGDFGVTFAGAVPDGSPVYFHTGEQLVSSDTDASTDVYQRSGSTTTLISAGAINGNGAFNAFFRGVSDTGTRAFFTTSEPLVAADTDTSTDVYQRAGSTTTLISAGQINGNGANGASFLAASGDGTRVIFTTSEQLVLADTDSRADIYQRSGSTTTLISAGAINGNGAFDAIFRGASDDATRVFFTTSEQLASVDTDASVDIYERSTGVTTRISGDASGDNGAFDASFRGASDDGTRVFFTTGEPLHTTDTDTAIDLYAHLDDGTVNGLSSDHASPDGPFDVSFGGNTPTGNEAFFATQEALPGAGDEDESTDVYQYDFDFNSNFRVSGPAINFEGGQGGFPAQFAGSSADGSRVFFTTFERLALQDVDGARDVYGTFVGSSLISREMRPPETTIGAGVPQSGFTNDTTPVFSFSSSEPGSSFQCRVVAQGFAPCGSPQVFGPLADGSRTIEVVATDAAGNPDPTPATRTFTVDTIAPDPSIDTGPSGLRHDPTPTFTFSADETVTFACRVDTDPYGSCTTATSHTTAALADGPHVFKLRARDSAGNTEHVHRAFAVDTTDPNTTINSVVVDSARKRATVNFSGSDVSTPLKFQCALDGGAFANCKSPKVFKTLTLGPHTVDVRAIDAAGNVDPTPASQGFSV